MSTERAIETSEGWVQPVSCDGPVCQVVSELPLPEGWITVATHHAGPGQAVRWDFHGKSCLIDRVMMPEGT